MNKKLFEELKEKLKNKKEEIQKELRKFAKENKKVKGDWDTKYPKTDSGVGGQSLEDAADQVEEYVNLLPVEYSLELRLQSINLALEKIKKGKYGKCENCKKNISIERLKISPEAKLCNKCRKENKRLD